MDIVEGSPPPQNKFGTTNNVRAINVEALTTFRNIGRIKQGKMMVICLDQLATLSGSRLGQAALSMEQRERLENKHSKNWATGRKVKQSTDIVSTALRRRNGNTPVGHSGWIALRGEQGNVQYHCYATITRRNMHCSVTRSCRNDIQSIARCPPWQK
jgi:hypothetical protein